MKSALLALIVLLSPFSGAGAQDGPSPPCGTAPYPPIPAIGAGPAVLVWSGRDLPAGWRPPACVGWPEGGSELVVALAGAIPTTEDAEAMLARFGAVSATRGMRYWSVTDGGWRVLVKEAFALDGADASRRRGDFTVDEMKSGADLYFAQKDNRSSNLVVYRMRVRTVTPERIAIAIENVTPVRLRLLTLFRPGDLRSIYLVERLSPTAWSFYSLSSVGEGASLLAGGHPSSYANRAVALYRHMAGVPTDRDPPYAAR